MLGIKETRGTYPPGYDPTWGYWPGDFVPTWSGHTVTQDTALQLLTVYGCVRLITDGISTMPVDVYRKQGELRIEITKPDWLEYPTVDLDFTAWCSQVLVSLLLHGNSYIWVTRNDRGLIVEVIPLNPLAVTVRRVAGRKEYVIGGRSDHGGEILHIKGLMMPGSDVGYSPIEAARQAIGLGLATQQFGSNFFDQGTGNMPGVIENPRPMLPGKMKELAELWQKKRAKGGRGLPGVLDDGATWKTTGVTNEDAQFLATRNYTAAEIAGQLFLIDPSDLGIPVQGTSLTYANLQERSTRRVQVAYLPWMIRIENAVSALLFNPRYMKFNADALKRASLKERYESYAIGIASGFLTAAEPRAWEDLPPMTITPPEVAPDDTA